MCKGIVVWSGGVNDFAWHLREFILNKLQILLYSSSISTVITVQNNYYVNTFLTITQQLLNNLASI